MIFGMTPLVFAHVLVSLIGIATGVGVLWGLFHANSLDRLTAVFLVSTVLTSASGFLLPAPHFLASHAIAVLSLIVLGFATLARYSFRMSGAWRKVYVITAVIALYFNVFVLVVQSFLKVPVLHDLAPTQSEPPFAIAQALVLVAFLVSGWQAVKKFREPAKARTAAR